MAGNHVVGTLLATALGIFALYMTQYKVMGDDPAMQKLSQLCMSGNATALKEAGLHEYEYWMGGSFVCIVTQFAYALAKEPAGMLAWGAAGTLLFPLMLLIFTEAGRPGARNMVKWPILVLFLSQVLGISFAFPCFWMNAAFQEGTGSGSPSTGRVWMAMLVPMLVLCLEVGVFNLDPHTHAWTLCADSLVGPGLALLGLLMWPFPAPQKPDPAAMELLKNAYLAFGFISAMGYYSLVFYAWGTFGSSEELLAALWGPKASPWVAFMTVDSSVLCLSMLLYLAVTCSSRDVLWAIVWSPFVGPASAYCDVLRAREERRLEMLEYLTAAGRDPLLPS